MASAYAIKDFQPPEAEDTVPPTRRATDVMKLTVPLPYTITLILIAIGIAAGIWQTRSDVSNINLKIDYERQLNANQLKTLMDLNAERQKTMDARFQALEAQITAAGLRGNNMSLSTALQSATKGK